MSHAGLLALAAATLAATVAFAADYYAGKSIELLIGAQPGGGYDIYARVVGKHLSRHIPGHPTIVPKNMPGAGSARAAGFISTMAPKDGTALGAVMPGAIMGPLLDEKAEALFDPTKVLYLGTANNGTRVCVTLKSSRIKSFDDLLTQKAVFGGVSSNDFDPGIRLPAQEDGGRAVRRRSGLSGNAGYCAGNRARRDRRRVRLGLVELQVAEAGLAARRQGRTCCCRSAWSPIPSCRAWASRRCSST